MSNFVPIPYFEILRGIPIFFIINIKVESLLSKQRFLVSRFSRLSGFYKGYLLNPLNPLTRFFLVAARSCWGNRDGIPSVVEITWKEVLALRCKTGVVFILHANIKILHQNCNFSNLILACALRIINKIFRWIWIAALHHAVFQNFQIASRLFGEFYAVKFHLKPTRKFAHGKGTPTAVFFDFNSVGVRFPWEKTCSACNGLLLTHVSLLPPWLNEAAAEQTYTR